MSEAASKPFDQPGAEGVELGYLRDVDEDVGPGSCQLFGVGNDLLQHRREAGRPGACGTQGKSIAACHPLHCRVTIHDANSCACSRSLWKGNSQRPAATL